MAKKKSRKGKSSRSGKSRTPIDGHIRKGSELLPPATQLHNLTNSPWLHHRLPEMIWASLILVSRERDIALAQFRQFLNFIIEHDGKEDLSDITLTGISRLTPELREELLTFLVQQPGNAQALGALRFFESLPCRDTWDRLLPKIEPDLDLLMNAVGKTIWHQSQESTDCRWVRLMAMVVTGKWKIPSEAAEEWLGYPNVGDQEMVRPFIRAAEIAINAIFQPDLTWPNAFWNEAWRKTPCIALIEDFEMPSFDEAVTRQRIREIVEHLKVHWYETHTTTEIDARHDAVFGMAFYSLRILDELLGIGIGTSILARLALRTILEIRINMRYLLSKNDMGLWQKWREYGAGQAKLNALKFNEGLEPPKYIDIESIEQIATEDQWEEFLKIELASWSGLDLRRMSERVGLKNAYDQYYSWTSGYAHGMWGPIRESCYETCGNPLHRLHRYPSRNYLQDVVDDAAVLIDEILNDLDKAFPKFSDRILI